LVTYTAPLLYHVGKLKTMGLTIAEKSQALTDFAEELVPSQAYVRTGNQAANTVFNILRSSTDFVDRVVIAGSMGKKFSIQDDDDSEDSRVSGYVSDFDLVVFCNHYGGSPSSFFHMITWRLKRILNNQRGIEVHTVNENCIQFSFNGYEFDLVPAINYVTESVSNVRELQKQRTYEAMDRSPSYESALRLNGGLAETSVYFAKQKSSLTHSVVRIAKYWALNLKTPSFPGLKLLVETVAIDATMTIERSKRQEYQSNRMYYAVREFLRQMKNFYNLDVIISTSYTYDFEDVPDDIENTDEPLVLDPVNYYNNLADNPDIVIGDFVGAAVWSLDHLDRIGDWEWYDIL